MHLKTPAALAAALTLALATGCATTSAASPDDGPRDATTSGSPGDAYPSTYRRIASAPVLVSGATVLDGTGKRLDGADVPIAFKGTAIAMITAGFMSLAFMGFAGLDRFH